MTAIGDLVTIRDEKGRDVLGIVVGGTANPDRLLTIMGRNRTPYLRYEDSCTMHGVVKAGAQHLTHKEARLRVEIDQYAKSKAGKQAIQRARMRTDVARQDRQYCDDGTEPSGGRGESPSYQPPADTRLSGRDEPQTAMETFLYAGDPHADAVDITVDEERRRTLDRLVSENPDRYRALLLQEREGLHTADIARLLELTPGYVRVALTRQRKAVRKAMSEAFRG